MAGLLPVPALLLGLFCGLAAAQARSPTSGTSAIGTPASGSNRPWTDEALRPSLAGRELPAFEQACQESARFDLPERLRQMQGAATGACGGPNHSMWVNHQRQCP